MDYRTLGKTGLKLATLGFGCTTLGNMYGTVSQEAANETVRKAIDLGINFFDVAPYYGLTLAEKVLGNALVGIPRDAYYLCTKVARYDRDVFDFSAERVTASVDESLERLKLDYIDLIIVHDIEFGSLDQVVNETIPALRRVQETGKVRFVGISGLPLKIFREVSARAELDFILSYCHYCLNDTSLKDIAPSLKAKNIGIVSASPLAMGLLKHEGRPAWHPASDEIKARVEEAARYCESKGANLSQLALQFSLAQTDFATTLVGMSNIDELLTNVQQLTEPIDQELLNEVLAILAPIHNQTWPSGRPENND